MSLDALPVEWLLLGALIAWAAYGIVRLHEHHADRQAEAAAHRQVHAMVDHAARHDDDRADRHRRRIGVDRDQHARTVRGADRNRLPRPEQLQPVADDRWAA